MPSPARCGLPSNNPQASTSTKSSSVPRQPACEVHHIDLKVLREWAYVDRGSNASEVEFPHGTRFHCRPVDVLDVPSVALATGAHDVSFAIGVGGSLGRRRGSSPSHELHIEACGTQTDGTLASLFRIVSAPRGQGWLTGYTIGQAACRLLDLDRHGPSPSGPVWPDTLLDCARFLQSLRAAGVEIQDFVFPKNPEDHDRGSLTRE